MKPLKTLTIACLSAGLPFVFATDVLAKDYRNRGHDKMGSASYFQGIYGKVMGGVGFTEDHDFETNAAGVRTIETELSTGLAILGAVGYDFGNWRSEFELSYRTNSVDVHNSSVAGDLNGATGDLMAFAAMINAYYDFENESNYTPYLGAGVGWASLDYDGYGVTGNANVVNDDDSVFAYQLMGGFDYQFSEHLKGIVEYRYFGTSDPEFTTNVGATSNDTDTEFSSHAILIGAGINF